MSVPPTAARPAAALALPDIWDFDDLPRTSKSRAGGCVAPATSGPPALPWTGHRQAPAVYFFRLIFFKRNMHQSKIIAGRRLEAQLIDTRKINYNGINQNS
jgi:hypothetical protein